MIDPLIIYYPELEIAFIANNLQNEKISQLEKTPEIKTFLSNPSTSIIETNPDDMLEYALNKLKKKKPMRQSDIDDHVIRTKFAKKVREFLNNNPFNANNKMKT